MKCYRCKIDKAPEEFSADRSKASGRKSVCRACDRAKAQSYYVCNRGRVLARTGQASRERYARDRAAAIAVYGGRCSWCGSVSELEFDHIDDNGSQHRETESLAQVVHRIAAAGRPIDDYQLQLLCWACHRGPGWRTRREAAFTGPPAAQR